jgi:hypothetical protein
MDRLVKNMITLIMEAHGERDIIIKLNSKKAQVRLLLNQLVLDEEKKKKKMPR